MSVETAIAGNQLHLYPASRLTYHSESICMRRNTPAQRRASVNANRGVACREFASPANIGAFLRSTE